MNRKIKFRVWDIRDKIMSYPENNDATEFFIHFGNWRVIRCYDGYAEKTLIWDSEYEQRYSIQQFTGLLDKNGKEIFEGDIISYTHSQYDGKNNCGIEVYRKTKYYEIIEFGEYVVITGYDRSEKRFGLYLKDGHGSKSPFTLDFIREVEIEGNIFENPELIKA